MQLTSCLHKIYKALIFSENQSSVACTDTRTSDLNFPLSSPSGTEITAMLKQINASKLYFRDRSSNTVYILQTGDCSFPQLTARTWLSGSCATHQGDWLFMVTVREY